MTHWRNQSGRQRLGGTSTSPSASIGNYAPSNSILLPADEPPFKRSQIAQACIDGICVVFGFIFLCSVVASLPLAVVIMFMVVR